MSDALNNAPKTAPRLPRGFGDRSPAELAAERKMLDTIRGVYELYGFEAVETPFIEYTDALGKFLPDTDRPNAGVFSLRDDDEQWVSLRYDLTAPLARHVAENFERLPKPYRSYRAGYVFRNEKPGPGRFRQFMQFDADTVGSASPAADAEICMMAADTMEALGFRRGDYVVKVNNRKILDGVMEAIGLGGEENAGRRLTVLRAIDKMDRLGLEGVRLLLGPGRKDESGDFTKGAGLDEEQTGKLLRLLSAAISRPALPDNDFSADATRLFMPGATEPIVFSSSLFLDSLLQIFGVNQTANAGIAELKSIANLVAASNYNDGRIVVDPSIVRGLEYYTGPVFEVELTFEVKDDNGKPVRFGSVAGGGRYDGLVARFREEPVPATGFSIGVSRLLAALQHLKKADVAQETGPVVVLVMDRAELAATQNLVKMLRDVSIRAEMYLGEAGMKAQLKYADRRNSPCVIIQGSNERAAGTVQVKDLALGATLNQTKDRAEYLALQARAQLTVPVAEMVETVRAVLARRG